MEELREIQVLEGHMDPIWGLAWSPKGDMLASCGADKTVRIWQHSGNDDRWHCTAILEDTHTRTIRACCWSPCGKYLATASFDATTSIWEVEGGNNWEQLSALEGHENEVKSVAWNPNGGLIATCSRDKTVWIWEVCDEYEFECVDVKHGHSQDVKMVAWHPMGEILASASYDNSIKLWMEDPDGDEWNCVQTLEGIGSGHSSTVWGVAFDGEGEHMASCSDDLSVKIWKCEKQGNKPKWRLASTLSGFHDRTISTVDWSKDGVIATGARDNGIRLFRPEENHDKSSSPLGGPTYSLLVKKENAHPCDVNCVQWHPVDSTLLASAGDDGMIRLWRRF
ncbi:hypothetical protein BSKO_07047 [Bryopsis sp. KO-2023]|nr:hypothetical protein BSKO_07047 [Bryopsis sp. KO-2023]